ncbi:ATP-dependent helicase HrpB [Desulfomicrobium macestii]|uniref:ATP-dependent helicase HrpB n=1 Tax=Desulfomicrobium macestii TaxID=90731 RepID=A0ABR9GYB1_9BACT|nr:ATP-dependent helicase HrpB [Desulfomicrobium macestii]MBE1423436.1 ATP-dependent helicase HrpB [Desulfomicrobium macestii]
MPTLPPTLSPSLPIDALLPELTRTLSSKTACLVHAPPGSGKTTRIPLALLDAAWLGKNKILMLEPRRLAARAAARHMAGLLGEKAGERVGYRTRLDIRVSSATRIEVVTEGILTRMLQHDPGLSGYGCVIFDEYHERSLQADLGLALCLEIRDALRPDLRLVIMSATLDAAAVAELLEPCRILSCPGQPHEVETRYLRLSGRFLEERMARAIRHALATEQGSILAFLPGAREIRRTAELLENPGAGVEIHPLLGALTAIEQDKAIAPPMPGTRKIVLATAIAETSLTIEGVRIVVDSGLARLPRFDPKSSMTVLVTEPASLATLTQRRGRAGRTEPGICFRIWDQADEVSRKPFPAPEMLEADLAPLALDLALWGATDPGALSWLTPPPAGHYKSAMHLLQSLEAVDDKGRITPHGREMALLPLHPRLGHMVLTAKKHGLAPTAAYLAAILGEPGRSMRGSSDLRDTLRTHPNPLSRKDTLRASMEQIARLASVNLEQPDPEAAGILIALAYPDRIARRQQDGTYRLASGRKAMWPGPSALTGHEFLAIADLDGDAAGAKIWQSAPVSLRELEKHFGGQLRAVEEVHLDQVRDRIVCLRKIMLDALCVKEENLATDPETMTRALLQGQRDLSRLTWTGECQNLRDRVRFLCSLDQGSWPDMSDQTLLESIDQWLGPFATGARSGMDLGKIDLLQALKALLGWEKLRELDRLAPEFVIVPTGAKRKIDYSPESGPVLPVKLQEMFGCATTPTLADGRHPLVLHLLSPAGRPLQVTRDLPSFWKSAYPLVRAEMRGRYPKHPWPEDPATAMPTAKTKKAMTPR